MCYKALHDKDSYFPFFLPRLQMETQACLGLFVTTSATIQTSKTPPHTHTVHTHDSVYFTLFFYFATCEYLHCSARDRRATRLGALSLQTRRASKSIHSLIILCIDVTISVTSHQICLSFPPTYSANLKNQQQKKGHLLIFSHEVKLV